MFCAHCSEKILGDSVKQGGEHFCRDECASLATGFDPKESNDYYEEDKSVDDFFEEFDE